MGLPKIMPSPNGFRENWHHIQIWPPPLSSSKLWMVFYTYNLPTIATVRFIAHGDFDMYDAKVMQYWSQLWEHWLWMKLF